MVSSAQAALIVECCVLAAYLLLCLFAFVLYFGRKSYKCFLLPLVKTQVMARSQASRKLALDVSQRWWLDLLVTSILVVILLRTLSEFVRVFTYARQLVHGAKGTPVLDQISTVVLLVSVTSYSFVFCALIWMWLRLFLSLFEENNSKKSCILWTIRVTTIGCIVSAVITCVAMSTIFCIPNVFNIALIPALAVILFCVVLYFVSLAALCTVVVVLGIRIVVLIKQTTAVTSPSPENDGVVSATRRRALTKVSFAVAAFVLALIIRTLGIGLMMLSMYIPSWIASLMLLSLPEFVTFITLIVILWPFRCCNRFDTIEEGENVQLQKEEKEEEKNKRIPKVSLPSATMNNFDNVDAAAVASPAPSTTSSTSAPALSSQESVAASSV